MHEPGHHILMQHILARPYADHVECVLDVFVQERSERLDFLGQVYFETLTWKPNILYTIHYIYIAQRRS